jgi:hypothetical protein
MEIEELEDLEQEGYEKIKIGESVLKRGRGRPKGSKTKHRKCDMYNITPPFTEETFTGVKEPIKFDEQYSRGAIISLIRNSRKGSVVKILRLLLRSNRDWYMLELARQLNYDIGTIVHITKVLERIGVVERYNTPVDRCTKYVRILNRDLAERIVKWYKILMSYKIAKTLPIDKKLWVDELIKDEGFKKVCLQYDLTPEEVIDAFNSCSMVRVVENPNEPTWIVRKF